MADKRHLHSHSDTHGVPRPLIISDAVLDSFADGVSLSTEDVDVPLAEWAHIDAKADMVQVLVKKRELLQDNSLPLLSRLSGAEALVGDYAARIPEHPNTRPVDMPHWAYMQRFLLELWAHDTVVQLYHPFFGSSDPEIAAHALHQGLGAAHRLVQATRGMLSFMLLDYVDAPSAALWTYTMKSFTAGLVMAYALLSDPASLDAPHHAAALDAMVGALRSCLPMGGSATANRQALSILENLRAKINGEADAPHGVTDPYTAKSYALPFSIQSVLPAEWVEWEALFRDLLEP